MHAAISLDCGRLLGRMNVSHAAEADAIAARFMYRRPARELMISG